MPREAFLAGMDFPDSDAWGARHVETALRDLEFPITKEKLLARAGAWRVPLTGARFVELRDLLAPVEASEFRSAEEVAREVRRATGP